MKIIKRIWLEKYVLHRNYINKGLNEIYSIKTVAQAGAGVTIVLKLFWDPSLKTYIYTLVGLSILTILGCWFIGMIWDKFKAYHIEAEFGNQRNPLAEEIRKEFQTKRGRVKK